MTRTAAHDTILRMALAMWQLDPKADLSAEQRAWIRDRLQVVDAHQRPTVLTSAERRKLGTPLVAYLRQYRPSIAPIVEAQCCAGRSNQSLTRE